MNATISCKLAAVLLIATLFFKNTATAQPNKLPPFRMSMANGKQFKAEDLPLGKPILLIYFSPDCDHCEKMAKEFFKQKEKFKNASVVMMTYLPVDKVVKFVNDYGVAKQANIFVGTEGATFFVRDYFKIKELPFAALYTKRGDFVISYERNIALKELAGKLVHL